MPGGIVTIDLTHVVPSGLRLVIVTTIVTGVHGNGVSGVALITVVTSGSTKPKLFSMLSSDLKSTICLMVVGVTHVPTVIPLTVPGCDVHGL